MTAGKLRVTRDLVLFSTGLGLFVWEAVVRHGTDAVLLPFFALMMGLPAFLPDVWKRSDPPPAPPPAPSRGAARKRPPFWTFALSFMEAA